MRRRVIVAVLAAAALVPASCGDGDGAATPTNATTTATPATGDEATASTTSPSRVGEVALRLSEVAMLDEPLAFAVRAGTAGFYVAEKGGRVRHVATPGAEAELVLDIAEEVSTGNEQGLLGLTFSPDGSSMFVSYTNVDGDTRVEEVDPDTGSRREVFALDQPYSNHNGGNIVFGPDGFLWLGLGDGGSGGDPDDRAQDPDDLLGKLLRLDPDDFEPRVYALGVRNPWRFSFDRDTGDLWVGDVGQDAWEEIDLIPAGTSAGVDLGWNLAEGTHGYGARRPPEDSLLPVYEYGHDAGQSVVGGYVYRGTAVPALDGTYLFADTYTGALWSLRPDGDGYAFGDLGIEVPGGFVASFGEDADGELYVLSLAGGVYRIDAG